MDSVVQEFERQKNEEQKKAFLTAFKTINQEYKELSNNKKKQHQNATMQSWQQLNPDKNLSLDNAIMYMQNVLSCVEHKIQNELRYSVHFKQVVSTQIHKLDLIQQIIHEESKVGSSSANEEE